MFKFKNLIVLLAFIVISSLAIQPSNFNFNVIEVDKPSEKDIYSPKTFTFVDESATNQLKEEALVNVQDVYEHDKSIYSKTEEDLNLFLNSLKEKKAIIDNFTQAQKKLDKEKQVNLDEFILKELESISNPFNFSTNQLKSFLKVDSGDLSKYSTQLMRELSIILYTNGVTSDNLDSSKESFIDKSDSLLFYTTKQVETVSPYLVAGLSNRIVVNFSLNQEQTSIKRDEALAKVEPVYKQLSKGELIVGKGEIVSNDAYIKLDKLGLLESEFDYNEFFYQIPYLFLILSLMHFYCFKFYSKYFDSFKNYLFLHLSIFVLIISSSLIDDLRYYLLLLTMFMFLIVIIWGRMFILSYSIFLGLIIYSGEFVYAATTIITGILISILYKNDGERMELIKTGFYIGVLFIISQFIFKMSVDNELTSLSVDFSHNVWFLASTTIAAILTIGVIPMIEKILGIATHFRLHEYNKHSHPLIKKLILEAPGTYDHSIKVGNLAELAADAIDANGLLVRVGAYYHDIGKIATPEYFIENVSPGTNLHNNLKPIESANIIKSHPIEGAKMAKEYKLPEPIIRMILTHHSDSILSHFYLSAKEEDPNVDINLFKYDCPRPVSKEEGILMLADSTEAYSRILLEQNLSEQELEKAIRSSVFSKVSNGDLRDCKLTMNDLEVIIRTFVKYLSKSNHKRIAYKTEDN